jgi:hypothetical protein
MPQDRRCSTARTAAANCARRPLSHQRAVSHPVPVSHQLAVSHPVPVSHQLAVSHEVRWRGVNVPPEHWLSPERGTPEAGAPE